jgi:hypothetical protein
MRPFLDLAFVSIFAKHFISLNGKEAFCFKIQNGAALTNAAKLGANSTSKYTKAFSVL